VFDLYDEEERAEEIRARIARGEEGSDGEAEKKKSSKKYGG
jgi:hypothetical protein